jgi:hypothetical protein
MPLKAADEAAVSHTKTLQVSMKELTLGSTFAGRYQVLKELGKGGMDRIYFRINAEDLGVLQKSMTFFTKRLKFILYNIPNYLCVHSEVFVSQNFPEGHNFAPFDFR